MFWKNGLWSAYTYAVDSVIGAAANTLNVVGSLACMIGGAGFASASGINETFTGAYYGNGTISGLVHLDVYFPQYTYTYKEDLPFQYSYEKDGSTDYQFQNYLQPDNLRAVSMLCVGVGMLCRLVGANLDLWQQHQMDKRFYADQRKFFLKNPSSKEFMYVSASAIIGSFAYASLANAVIGGVIDYSGWMGSSQSFTYPANSTTYIASQHYSGPVNAVHIPLNYLIAKNVTVNLPVIGELKVDEKVELEANATALYGAGVFAVSHSTPDYPIAVPLTVGSLAYLGSAFFANSAKRLRDERIHNEQPKGFLIV